VAEGWSECEPSPSQGLGHETRRQLSLAAYMEKGTDVCLPVLPVQQQGGHSFNEKLILQKKKLHLSTEHILQL